MATVAITSPSAGSPVSTPFDLTGTCAPATAQVEVRGENGLLLPATENPKTATGGSWTIHITSLVGTMGAAYSAGNGYVFSTAENTITYPTDASTVASPVTFTGTTTANAEVELWDSDQNAFGIESGFPVTRTHAYGSNISSVTSPSFTTTGASMLVVILGADRDGTGDINTVTLAGTGGASGLTFTKAEEWTCSTRTHVSAWYAYSNAAIETSATAVATLAASGSGSMAAMAVYSITGASSTIGAHSGESDSPGGTQLTNRWTTLTATEGSLIVGISRVYAVALSTLQTDCTTDLSTADGSNPCYGVFRYGPTASTGSKNVGYTGTGYWTMSCAIEVNPA